MELITKLLSGYKPIIAVIHLPPLADSPHAIHPDYAISYAIREAKIAVEAGVDALILENYGDKPYTIDSSFDTVAVLAAIVREIQREVDVPIGVSVLRLGWRAALAVAQVAKKSFIRVNTYCETRESPEGILYPTAAELERKRHSLPKRVAILADIDVKHSNPITPDYNVIERLRDCIERGLADAYIVSSSRTGKAPPPGYVAALKSAAGRTPIIIGSGITVENIAAYWDIADGFIVGSYLKKDGVTVNSFDASRVEKIVRRAAELRRKSLPVL